MVVVFPDYGNSEEVLITDIRPVPKNAWVRLKSFDFLQCLSSWYKIALFESCYAKIGLKNTFVIILFEESHLSEW